MKVLFTLLLAITLAAGVAVAKPGLLVIAHGAPMPEWNQPVLDLEGQIKAELGDDSLFLEVKVALLEFVEPSVTTQVKALEETGCDRIIAVPLFIAPSSHSHWDIPTVLGLYTDAEMRDIIAEEGGEIVETNVPITITETLADGNLLLDSALARVEELSINPDEEALVVVAHGDTGMEPYWDRLLKRTTTYCLGKSGISYGDWATIEIGGGFVYNAVPVIAAAGEERKRVIVIGVYVMSSVKRIAEYYGPNDETFLNDPFEGFEVLYAERSLLPDPMVTTWIIETALSAVETR